MTVAGVCWWHLPAWPLTVVAVSRWSEVHEVARGRAYDDRWRRMQAEGEWVHGEADLVSWLEPGSVLDAGCGTGRVAMELDRRGLDVVGVDLDPQMLEVARRKAPHLRWIVGDLVDVDATENGGTDRESPRSREDVDVAEDGGTHCESPGSRERRAFDLVVMAGNVMVFVAEGTEAAVVANMARHLRPGGLLVAGFQLGRSSLTVVEYDRFALDAGLALEHRWSTWDRERYEGGSYAVSVHRCGSPLTDSKLS